MKLKSLIENLAIIGNFPSNFNTSIKSITDDSRKVTRDTLFIAVPGLSTDAHKYINDAIENGAVAVVGEKNLKLPVTYIRVNSSRKALSIIAANFYGNPAKKLKIIGITGTDGKTTTASMVHAIIAKSGKKVGLISTLSAKIGERVIDTGLHVSMPEPLKLQKILKDMVIAKCEYCILEVTSHGLDQERGFGIKYDVGLITNISPEHLDYHGTFKNYMEAKAKLISQSEKMFINKKHSSSFPGSDHFGYKDCYLIPRITNHLNKFFPGDYNRMNFAGSCAICKYIGISKKDIEKGIISLKGVEGRYEQYLSSNGKSIIVDFSHTAQGVDSLLKNIYKKHKKITVVFGCPGSRDKGKRPIMGRCASRYCTDIVLTVDDPRTENPLEIIEEIKKGIPENSSVKCHVELNRYRAIKYAIKELLPKSDVVAIVGKGHEKSLSLGNLEYPWSDKEIVQDIISMR